MRFAVLWRWSLLCLLVDACLALPRPHPRAQQTAGSANEQIGGGGEGGGGSGGGGVPLPIALGGATLLSLISAGAGAHFVGKSKDAKLEKVLEPYLKDSASNYDRGQQIEALKEQLGRANAENSRLADELRKVTEAKQTRPAKLYKYAGMPDSLRKNRKVRYCVTRALRLDEVSAPLPPSIS